MAADGDPTIEGAPPLLDALLAQDEIGVAVWDAGLRFACVNAAFAAMNGAAPAGELDRLASDVAASGSAAVGLELNRGGRHWRASYHPLRDARGEIVGVTALATDVTRRKRAEAELERRDRDDSLVTQVNAMLSSSHDAKQMLRGFARLAVPRLADWCVVDIVQDDGSLRRVALAHADRSKEDHAWDLTRRYPSGADAFEFTPKAIRSSRHELVPEIRDSLLARIARDEAHLVLLRELGLRSLIVVPLTVRGATLGAIALVSAQSGRRYDAHDLALAQSLADRCALAVDNARLAAVYA